MKDWKYWLKLGAKVAVAVLGVLVSDGLIAEGGTVTTLVGNVLVLLGGGAAGHQLKATPPSVTQFPPS